ncbi:MAG: YdcF family protein [bacterium]|nr:YdcF family protein [bacterium]
MESESHFIPENKEGEPKHFRAIIVSPGYENNEHRTGLHWDTRFRLLAAAAFFESGRAEKIIVGGGKLREMKESFAELMKKELLKRGIPEDVIDTEEYTFDTASQIDWITKNLDKLEGDLGFITDPAQAGHVKALMEGFGIDKECSVLSTEDIIGEMANNKHFLAFFEELHGSPYWKKWQLREKVLELFTKYFDPKGEKLAHITTRRKT